MTDPRVAPVEHNLLDFLDTFTASALFVADPDDDVRISRSGVDFPMFNPVHGADFAPAAAAARATSIAGRLRRAGQPFLWWVTPSTTSAELEEALVTSGLDKEETYGMHVTLGDRPGERGLPAGVELLEVDVSQEPQPLVDTMLAAFGMPEWLAAPFEELCRDMPPARFLNLLATVEGYPVATGSGWLTGPVVGLYNIATLEEHRGRGIGTALTNGLMDLARGRGAEEAVLHATESGRPVHARLGFVEVCRLPQYLWAPED